MARTIDGSRERIKRSMAWGVTTSCMAIASAWIKRPEAGTTSSTAGMATIFFTATPMRCTTMPKEGTTSSPAAIIPTAGKRYPDWG